MGNKSRDIRNVTVLMPDKHMGNLIVSLPALISLQNLFYGRNITLVIDESYKDIIDASSCDMNVLLYPRKRLRSTPSPQKTSVFLSFLKKLRKTSPDLSVDVEGRDLSALLTFLSGARRRLGFTECNRSFFYTDKVSPQVNKHRAYTYLALAEAAGAKPEFTEPHLRATADCRSSLKAKLVEAGLISAKPIVSIHPGAAKNYKRWSAEGFATISDFISLRAYQVVFIGGPSDRAATGDVISRMQEGVCDCTNRLSLGELIALFEQSALFVGNDSGPMHLAAAAGAPVIGLFGHSDENRWKPLAEKSVVLKGNQRCERCDGEDCKKGFDCILSLSPDAVKAAVIELLGLGEAV